MNRWSPRQSTAFTLIELIVVIAIVLVLAGVAAPAVWGAYKSSSLAVSASNIRQLAAGGAAYLGDNNYRFWPYLVKTPAGDVYWFGLEAAEHRGKPEGERIVDMQAGPLGAYMPRSFRPDPSFGFTGKPFKPKYSFGYIGVGYNVHLAGETKSGKAIWLTRSNSPPPLRYWDLKSPAETVVFATSAQVYPFRKDAVIEEFYGIDDKEVTVHFRHKGQAMVGFANGSAGFLPMDPATRDSKAPDANVGRFAPKGSKKYLR